MGSDQGVSRLDTLEMKSLIFREIGNQRAESYFHHLGNFFALKITKSEFDKLCIKTIGRQNIHLHNRLIRSIIKNASVAKSPPLKYPKKGGNFVRFDNADSTFSPSSRKCKSRKFRDRLSPLGPLGKPQSISTTNEESMLLSFGSRPEEGEEVEQIAGSPSIQSRSPVTAPLGVSMSGITRKSISCETCQSNGELPDTRTLRSRLEKRLEMEGLKIGMESVNLLNNGLDAFMKRLIEPCLSLANTRCGKRLVCVSMTDFRAGVELNPRILGEDWPIHVEKICSRASDE